MDGFAAVVDLARRQYGLIERGQAAALDVNVRALNVRARQEEWERLHRGVLALPGSLDSPQRRILAAVLATQGDAWATRWTAAYLWGLQDRLRVPITVTVPHTHRAAALHGVKTVRTRTLQPEDVTTRHGIPTVSAARMVADLAPVVAVGVLRGLAFDARQKRLLQAAELWGLWERLSRAPRHRKLRLVAMSLMGDVERVDSELEYRLRALARRGGLPVPYPEPFPVSDGGAVVARIDIAWPRWKVGVECDGFRHHSERRQLDRDSARQNRLVSLGWQIVRVTWNQVENEPEEVVGIIHRILAAAGAVWEA